MKGHDTRRLHAMALLLAGQTVEGNQRHTTDAFISTAFSQGETGSCGYRADAPHETAGGSGRGTNVRATPMVGGSPPDAPRPAAKRQRRLGPSAHRPADDGWSAHRTRSADGRRPR